MALARDVEDWRTLERARSLGAELGIRPGKRAEQRGVVGLRSRGSKMPSGSRCKPGPLGDRANHVSLYLDGRWRGRKGRQLRIERRGNPVCALRWEGRSWIEQAEVARMIYMDKS